ncbi:MAG TPA: hypothetical protein VFS02_01615 [Telluria sp.]|nr:hypothetical protein [Telluria sp.]
MRRRFGQALRLGVAHDGIALVKTSRWGAHATLLSEHAGAPDSAALAALLGEYAGWPLTIVLADELVRLWQVTPPQHSTRVADLEAAAALRFQHLYGEPAANWRLSAGWHPDRPFLAAAMPRALLGALEQGAAAVPLIEIVPQFIAVYNRWSRALKPGAWFGVVHDQVLTVGACDGGAIVAVRAAAVPDGADAGWLDAHVAREALRLNLPTPSRLQLWGSVPAAWLAAEPIACSRLGVGEQPGWTAAARLAASGSAA